MKTMLEEDLTSLFYPDVSLPPLWQVIYHEAMRGHHILFDKDRLETSSSGFHQFKPPSALESDEYFIDLALELFYLPDLKSMRQFLEKQSTTVYLLFFKVYICLIQNLQKYVKSQLN